MNRTPIATAIAIALSLYGSAVTANPQGASVIHGQVSIDPVSAQQLTITASDKSIINWQSFGISADEITRFIQPSSLSTVLNRVVGQDPSQIMGQLQSNGRVFLINPNGIVFGQNAVVDTAGLIASTLNMTDGDFLQGKLNFEGGPDSGDIHNQGFIRAGANGEIALIAPNIINSGVLQVDEGRLLLAAGEKITITSLDMENIEFLIQAPDNEVVNLGEVLSRGGAVQMFAGTIRHSGVIRADSIGMDQQGRVVLKARDDIVVSADASITANGPAAGEIHIESLEGTTLVSGHVEATSSASRGGKISILGNNVGIIESARVDASGHSGGGEVLVGGDFQGSNPDVKNAGFSFVGGDTEISADALDTGDGGKVIVWADDTTRAYGKLSATGGDTSGDGGFVEISGKQNLVFEAQVDTTATNGGSGLLLLDPETITIVNGGGQPDDVNLPVFDNSAGGDAVISELALEGQATNVLLIAPQGITLDDLADDQLAMNGLVNAESITLRTTTGDITFVDVNDEIFTAGGDIILESLGGGSLVNIGNIRSLAGNGGDIFLTATSGNIDLQGNVISTGTTSGDIAMEAGGTITQALATVIQAGKFTALSGSGILLPEANIVQQFTGLVSGVGDIQFTNSGNLVLAANGTAHAVQTNAGDADIFTGANLQVGNSIDVNGNLFLTSNGQGIDINAPVGVAGIAQFIATGAGTGDGEIRQGPTGVISAAVLDVIADQAVLLNGATNQIGIFSSVSSSALNSGTLLTNGAGPLALGPVTDVLGNISISSTGGIIVIGNVDANSGNLTVSSGGNIDGDGSGASLRAGGSVSLSAADGIGITNRVVTNTGSTLLASTSGIGSLGNIALEETNGPLRFDTSRITLSTDSTSSQQIDLTFPNGLNVDASLGDPLDDMAIHTPGRDIQEGAGNLIANSLILDSDTGIGGAGALLTQASTIAATVASGGALNIDNTGNVTFTALSNNIAGDIQVNETGGSGTVTINGPVNSGGLTRLNARAGGDLIINANVTGPGTITLDSVGGGSVVVSSGQNVSATSAGSDVDVLSSANIIVDGTMSSATQDVILSSVGAINMGAAGSLAAANNVDVNGGTGVILGQIISGNSVAVNGGSGSITDGNGAAGNISNTNTTTLTATAGSIGTFTDPLELQTPVLNVVAVAGQLGVVNNGPLTIPNGSINATSVLIKTTVGDLTFSPAVTMAAATNVLLEAQTNLNLLGGLTANSALLDMRALTGTLGLAGVGVAANDILMSGNLIQLDNGAQVNSSSNLSVNANSLVLDAGAIATTTKLLAPGTITITGGNVTVSGGTAANAAASIDPALLNINITGNLNISGGTGVSTFAVLSADTINITAGGAITLTGGGAGAFAAIDAVAGNVTLSAGTTLDLIPGGSADADAVIIANAGTGVFTLAGGTCPACLQLPTDPILDSLTQSGVFAGTLVVPVVPTAGGAATGGGNEIPAVDEVLVLDALFQSFEDDLATPSGSGQEDEDDDKPILVCS